MPSTTSSHSAVVRFSPYSQAELLLAAASADKPSIPKEIDRDAKQTDSRRHRSQREIEREDALLFLRSLLGVASQIETAVLSLQSHASPSFLPSVNALAESNRTLRRWILRQIDLAGAKDTSESIPPSSDPAGIQTQLTTLTRELRNPLEPLRAMALRHLRQLLTQTDKGGATGDLRRRHAALRVSRGDRGAPSRAERQRELRVFGGCGGGGRGGGSASGRGG